MDTIALAGWLDQRVTDHSFSSVALIWQDGAPVFSHAGGIAERRFGSPVTPDTRFGVASITKLVSATTCLQLVDRDLLSLTAPILDVLPGGHRTSAMTPEHTLHHLDDDPYRLATGYLATDEPPHHWRSTAFGVAAGGMPDGGLVTTATDRELGVDDPRYVGDAGG